VLVPPVTVAVNCAVPPRRVCAAPATVTAAGVTGAACVERVLLPPHPLKPNKKPVARVTVTGPCGKCKWGMLRVCNDKAGMVPPTTCVLPGWLAYCWEANRRTSPSLLTQWHVFSCGNFVAGQILVTKVIHTYGFVCVYRVGNSMAVHHKLGHVVGANGKHDKCIVQEHRFACEFVGKVP
jgi:hypothetical protein